MSLRLAALAVVLAIVFTAVSGNGQEVLTNDAVISMKKAGLSDPVILAKIRSSQAKFDVSTQALVALKEVGLPDQIIEAMLAHTTPGLMVPSSPGLPSVPGPTAARQIPQGRGGVFHVRGEQHIELAAAFASLETNFAFFTSKSEIVLKGRRATYRIDDRQPVFVSTWAPNEAPLARLRPGDDHDDRNLKFSSGSFMPFGGAVKQGVRTEDVIDVDAEKDPRGFYRIKPRQSLPPGEYGFIVTHGFAGGAGGGRIFDFGID